VVSSKQWELGDLGIVPGVNIPLGSCNRKDSPAPAPLISDSNCSQQSEGMHKGVSKGCEILAPSAARKGGESKAEIKGASVVDVLDKCSCTP
jgi:hypothetical protein